MRLITYRRGGEEKIGGWIDGDARVVDLEGAAQLCGEPAGWFASMLSLIEAGPAAWDTARSLVQSAPSEAVFETAGCTLLAPLPRPVQIRDCLSFPGHLEGVLRAHCERAIAASPDPENLRAQLEAEGRFDVPASFYEIPVYYLSNRMAVAGPDVDVVWPAYSVSIDYEMDWAVVIGSECRAATRDTARDHIFGYTVFNDWSARDEQMRVMTGAPINLGPGAGKDFCNGFGPCIVTPDDIADPYRLTMTVRVNGAQVSQGSTAGMHFTFEDQIASLSRAATLYPGEFIGSGTVGGGCAFESGRVLASGDVVELEVEGIGVLRNRVLAPHIARSF
jgi:2-keto-4-pentenoate hydratase/2-oxohepta-3-ene-1,7-dioic acid hydratase in catechol pathway